jgi:hypothetical protein
MTNEQKEHADKIVEYFKNENGPALTIQQIEKHISSQNTVGYQKTKPILSILVHHGILLMDKGVFAQSGLEMKQETYVLTPKGWAYETYDKLLADEKIKEELADKQIQSVIDTNTATQDAYDTQRKQNRISIRLVAAATILSLATLIKEFWPPQPIIDRETKQLLQKQATSQDSLQQILRRIDSTFRSVGDSLRKKT